MFSRSPISALDSTWGKEHRKTPSASRRTGPDPGAFRAPTPRVRRKLSKAIGTATFEGPDRETAPAPSPRTASSTANTQWQGGAIPRALVRERLITPDETHDAGNPTANTSLPRPKGHARAMRCISTTPAIGAAGDSRNLADPNPFCYP